MICFIELLFWCDKHGAELGETGRLFGNPMLISSEIKRA